MLAFDRQGEGMPVVWQHGLGADRSQAAEVFPYLERVSRITLECRGHGASELGDPERLSIATFAEDVVTLLDRLSVHRAVVGGISLGAAVALRLAVDHPDRVIALVLARPAWFVGSAPSTLRVYREVAELIADHGPEEGARRFESSPLLAEVAKAAPDNAASLRGFFARPNLESTIALLKRIPRDGPGVGPDRLSALTLPVLVIANDHDYVHPLATARSLAAAIPPATFTEITSKSVDRSAYVAEFRQALAGFLVSLPRPANER
jgi:pimeloyl-ACP methyl ester carboxylesterase